jgi:hypothetical protein
MEKISNENLKIFHKKMVKCEKIWKIITQETIEKKNNKVIIVEKIRKRESLRLLLKIEMNIYLKIQNLVKQCENNQDLLKFILPF